MNIKMLMENTSVSDKFCSEHGLSIYIETNDIKIIFDVGASDLFLKNAKNMNVDISDIDYAVISHGHYDHGGGLNYFLNENKKAKIFIKENAFEKHYALRSGNRVEFIGIEEELKNNRQIVLVKDSFKINENIELFSNVIQKELVPSSNSNLLMEEKGEMVQDTFTHEQNLIIKEDDKTLLITGCAHNGIVNIVKHFYKLKGYMPDYVIGGFHLSSRSNGIEDKKIVENIAKELISTKAKYYTCHCTGIKAYNELKDIMGEKIEYLSAGSEINL